MISWQILRSCVCIMDEGKVNFARNCFCFFIRNYLCKTTVVQFFLLNKLNISVKVNTSKNDLASPPPPPPSFQFSNLTCLGVVKSLFRSCPSRSYSGDTPLKIFLLSIFCFLKHQWCKRALLNTALPSPSIFLNFISDILFGHKSTQLSKPNFSN